MQALAPPGGGAYEFIGQRHCCDAPARQYKPAEQRSHEDEPGVAENVPARQLEQPDLPVAELKVPGGQRLHALLFCAIVKGLNVPELQFVNATFPLLGPQNEPVGHGKHHDALLA